VREGEREVMKTKNGEEKEKYEREVKGRTHNCEIPHMPITKQ